MNFIFIFHPKNLVPVLSIPFLEKNFSASVQSSFFIPPFKEFYTFPKNTDRYRRQASIIEKEYKKEIDNLCDSERKFFSNLATEFTKEKKAGLLFLRIMKDAKKY